VLPVALSNGEVILLVVLLVAPIAAIAFAGSGAVYREIGKGAFSMDRDEGGDLDATMERSAARAEVRQMLEAKAFRQRERGETPLDVEAELRRMTAPSPATANADPALVAEVRQLVIARNARRERRGKEPLDVEAEVSRQLRDLSTPS